MICVFSLFVLTNGATSAFIINNYKVTLKSNQKIQFDVTVPAASGSTAYDHASTTTDELCVGSSALAPSLCTGFSPPSRSATSTCQTHTTGTFVPLIVDLVDIPIAHVGICESLSALSFGGNDGSGNNNTLNWSNNTLTIGPLSVIKKSITAGSVIEVIGTTLDAPRVTWLCLVFPGAQGECSSNGCTNGMRIANAESKTDATYFVTPHTAGQMLILQCSVGQLESLFVFDVTWVAATNSPEGPEGSKGPEGPEGPPGTNGNAKLIYVTIPLLFLTL